MRFHRQSDTMYHKKCENHKFAQDLKICTYRKCSEIAIKSCSAII